MTDIAGGTVFITGGAQGIGLGMARAFARSGARVALADIDQEQLAAAEQELSGTTTVAAFQLDVRDRDAFARVADAAEAQLGPVTVLCNNAGIGSPVQPSTVSYALSDHLLGINLGGVVNGVQTFLPRMLARGGPAHIVNTASGAGLVPNSNFLYSAAKFAVVGLSESLHQQAELAERGIRVTVVCPGFVRTRIVTNSVAHQPLDAPSPEQQAVIDTRLQLFERYGLDPDVVGEQVLDAVRGDRLYVHTDRMLVEPLQRRTRDLLEAMPEETERDREIAAVFRGELAAALKHNTAYVPKEGQPTP